MHKMEEGVRSGGVLKKKSSSGCLIIKKKADGMGDGVGSSGSHQGKKRPRLILSDSGSSDDVLEPLPRKVDKFRNGSVVYKKRVMDDSTNGETDTERKRNRLDLFQFDKYNNFDGKRLRNVHMDDSLKIVGQSGNQREFGGESSRNVIIDNRKHSHFEGTNSVLGGRNKGVNCSVKSRFEKKEDEAHLPISLLREKFREVSDEPIRLQGKNGVLKVMVNKNKKPGLSHKSYNHQEAEERKGSLSEVSVKENLLIRPSFYSDPKRLEKSLPYVRTEKSDLKLQKSLPTKRDKVGDPYKNDNDTSLKLRPGSTSMRARSSEKSIGKCARPTENITPIKGKEGKVNRGTGTEKQILRERIRNMLVSAGWSIDYRPRRSRDYLDAVYINPTGTAYWSIIKAYDALQKQLEEEDNVIKAGGDSSCFTPLPKEILRKLTRQTRKKIEKEMKRKKRDNGGSTKAKEAAVKEPVEGTDSDEQEENLGFQNCKSLKGRMHEADNVTGDDSGDNIYKGMPKQDRDGKLSNSHMIHGRKSRKIGRCALLVRSSDKGQNSEADGYVPYTGKRTLLAWLIDTGTVQLSEKVQYMNRRRTRVMLEGWITRDGIHCGCCSKILSLSKFELHAGTKQRQPFQNIILESGVSLLQCQIDAWNRQAKSESCGFYTIDVDGDDPNDDTCSICGDGGDLICCDGCPSTMHQSCLDIQVLSPGDWHCPNCTCKFCGIASDGVSKGHSRTSSVLLICSLCQKKYHESCNQEMDALPADSINASTTFCGQKCQELFDHLQKLLGVKHELEPGFSWSLIHQTDPGSDTSNRGFPQRVECNSKLAVALSVMNECFLPIFDRRSGINLIHNVVYNCGSNFSRLNYSGFYTAILERGDEIISAASIRIHGTHLAEMPYIGTRHIYRRQGMCRRLLCAIELTLCSLKVEKLVIPSIAEHMHTWIEVFGFNPLEESHKKDMKSINMLIFPGTDMLQKQLVKQEVSEGDIIMNSGTKCVELKDGHLLVPDSANKSDVDSSAGNDSHVCSDAGVYNVNEINDKVADLDSGLQAPSVPLDGSIVIITNSSDVSRDSKLELSSKDTLSIRSPLVNKAVASAVILEMERPVLDSPVKDHIQSFAEGVTGDSDKLNADALYVGSLFDSLGETSARNITKKANDNQIPVFVSTVLGTDESTMQINFDLNNQNAVEPESKLHVSSMIASDAEVAPVEGNIQSSAESSGIDAQE